VSRRLQSTLLLGAALLVAAALPPAARAADPAKRAGLVDRLHRLWDQIRQKREDIAETETKEHRVSDLLQDSHSHLEHSQRELRLARERVAAAQKEVDAATKRLYAAHQKVRRHSKRLGRRIAHHYVEGTISYADVLLGAATVAEFLDRQYLVERVLDWDRAVLRELRQAQRQVEEERANLLRRRALLLTAKAEIAAKTAVVKEQLDAHKRLLSQVQKERQFQEQELDELEQDSMEIERRLKAEERRRAGLGPRRGRYRLRWSGTFSLPSYGPVTSGFGYRIHPILGRRRLHTGIDFGAPMGSPIYAAAAGEVFHAGWLGGYGRCIIILHGDGISTLYGHCSEIAEKVLPGKYVRRGQRIGNVGSTGFSTGPHLHFEVRKDGVPINPMP
jgi:murein DD-endopeptidase MepM/ murein hydrolase activator NlpD